MPWSSRAVGVSSGILLAVVAALTLGTVPALAPAFPSAPGLVDEPDCRIALVPARESHGNHYSTRCNFTQAEIRIELDSRLYDVDPNPRLSGDLDSGDAISCRVVDKSKSECRGRAGADVRVGGYLETRRFNCNVSVEIRVFGGPDCRTDDCPLPGYSVKRRFRPPPRCA